jgi:NADH-quinone oxidoreductase subunit E
MVMELDVTQLKTILDGQAEKIDSLIDSYSGKREELVSLLQDVQAEFNFLPRDVIIKISEKLDVPLSQVYSVATFFKSFSLQPRGRHIVTVCQGTACHVRKGQRMVDIIERKYGVKSGETTDDMRFTLETVNCLGCCALGPVVVVDGQYHSQMNADKLTKVLEKYQ